MKTYLKLFLAFMLTVSGCVPAFGDAVIFSGSDVKTLKANIDLFGNSKILSGSVDPTSVATSAPVGSIYLNTSTGLTYRKLDAGSSTNWTVLGSGSSSGKNYITNGQAEAGTTGWATYADAAGTSPVNGTGGSPTTTWTRSTSTPLAGIGSFILTKDAANRQGEGASYDFALDLVDRAKVLKIDLSYLVNSGTFVAGTTGSSATASDVTVWLYDVTNSTLIQPSSISLFSNSTTLADRYTGYFQTSATGASYRLIVHVGSTSASAYTLKIDDVSVTPSTYVYGTPVTDWQSFVPTGSWSTNTTYSGFKRRVGDLQEYDIKVATTGAPTSATLTVNLGATLDTSKLAGTDANAAFGQATIFDATGIISYGVVGYNATDSVKVFAVNTAGTYADAATVTQAVPFTFATGDYVRLKFSVPISGWSSSVQMSDNADTRIVAARYSTNVGQSVANTGDTLIDYEDREFDTHGAVTTGGSWKFTAPVSGYYRVTAANVFTASVYAAGNQYYGTVYKNGSAHSFFGLNSVESTTSQSVSPAGSVLVQLNAGEYADVRLFNNRTAGATTLNGTTGANYISVEKVNGPSAIAATETISALYTGTPPTGTLTNSYNTTTFGTRVKDTHNAYSGGSYTVPASGVYSIAAQTRQNATYAINKLSVVSIFIDGVEKYSGYHVAAAAVSYLWPSVSAHSVPLTAGQIVTIRSYNDATTPTFGSAAPENFFSIVRTGNY